MTTTTVSLACSDDNQQVIQIPMALATMSRTLQNMIEDFFGDAVVMTTPIPLHNVTHATMLRVIACWEHKHAAPTAAPADPSHRYEMDAWERAFLADLDQGTLFELILAANYLDTKALLDMTCTAVAEMIRGKTPEEIRKTFNIKNDFTPEEEEKIRRENEWAEEK